MAEFPAGSLPPSLGEVDDDFGLDRLFLAEEDDFPPIQSHASDPAVDTAPSTRATSPIPAAPEPKTATPKPSGERPNRYAGSCAVCGKRVEAKEGLTWRKVDRWVVRHVGCELQ